MNLNDMSHGEFMALLRKQGACADAVEWCKKHGGTPAEMWRDCERGDWIGWFIRQNLEALGYTLQDWAAALSLALEEAGEHLHLAYNLHIYGKTGNEVDLAVALLEGYALGLSEDLNFPAGRWTFLSETADIFKDKFPIFGDEHERA